METLLAAAAAFLLTHFVSSTPLRAALVKSLGEWPEHKSEGGRRKAKGNPA